MLCVPRASKETEPPVTCERSDPCENVELPASVKDEPVQDAGMAPAGSTELREEPTRRGATQVMTLAPPDVRSKTVVMSLPSSAFTHVIALAAPPVPSADAISVDARTDAARDTMHATDVPRAIPQTDHALSVKPQIVQESSATPHAIGETRIVSLEEWVPREHRLDANGEELSVDLHEHAAAMGKAEPEGSLLKPPGLGISSLLRRWLGRLRATSTRQRWLLGLVPLTLLALPHLFVSTNAANLRGSQRDRNASVASAPTVQSSAPQLPQPASEPALDALVSNAPVSTVSHQGRKSVLREAVDALAEGNHQTAQARLEQLLAADPANLTYRAALRVLARQIKQQRSRASK